MWVFFPEEKAILTIQHCQCYQKERPKKIIILNFMFFFPLFSQNFKWCFLSNISGRNKKGNEITLWVYFSSLHIGRKRCWACKQRSGSHSWCLCNATKYPHWFPNEMKLQWKPYGGKCHVYSLWQRGAGLVSHIRRQCATVLNRSTPASSHFLRRGHCRAGHHWCRSKYSDAPLSRHITQTHPALSLQPGGAK